MWLKIKVWTKITVAAALIVYALMFIFQNSAKPVTFWWWVGREQPASVFTLSSLAFVAGAIAAILVRTTFKTLSQIRELQRRSKSQKLEREIADMKSKAGRLKQRDPMSAAQHGQPSTAIPPLEDEPL